MYVRKVDDQVLTLRVSGKLWMRSLIMSDIETKTEWSHLLGRGMKGKLKGKTLEPIVTDMLTWGAWKKDHPQTTVTSLDRESENYTSEFYKDTDRFVFGFRADGKSWAISISDLVAKPVHCFRLGEESLVVTFDKAGTATRLFDANVDELTLEFVPLDDETMKDTNSGSRWSISRGEAIDGSMKGSKLKQRVGIMSFRKAWQNFHPRSQDVEF